MNISSDDLQHWQSWVGQSETATDVIDLGRARAMGATLDLISPLVLGDPLPPLWHWIYFWSASPLSMLGADGHAQRGGFLPPVSLQRRLWAGGRLHFLAPLPIGVEARRASSIRAIEFKQGKSGLLVFVTVAYEVLVGTKTVLREEHDIVYRDAPKAHDPAIRPDLAPAQADWSRQIQPDPVQLFRYSALTFNGHRIHYDHSYATEVEGYPGLIVHGPLIATLLTELVRRELPNRTIREFKFRAVSPIFDIQPFSVYGQLENGGRSVSLWAANARGELAVKAEALLTGE